MTFQEFLATKRALAIVEHMETLSEADALELFESLDDATVELIEQLLDEGSMGYKNLVRKDRAGANDPNDTPGKFQVRTERIAGAIKNRERRVAARVARGQTVPPLHPHPVVVKIK